ncbi:tetratricopeptide repeat protein [Streptomyces sp. NPDC060223]|uniref:tetratricopeptide repeat protein n=1 Tax=unclassified Streptomyces TaxID=2593676 RepID=UPI0036339E59
MTFYEAVVEAFRRREMDVVQRLSEEEITRARAAGDVAGEVEAVGCLARVAIVGGDLPEARRLAEEARELARRSSDRRLERTPLHILAGTARMAGDVPAARRLLAESIALNESLGERGSVANERHNLAYLELHAGEVHKARELFSAARREVVEGEMTNMYPQVALSTAVIAAADGDHRRATRYLAAVDSELRRIGHQLDPDDAQEHQTLRERLVEELGRDSFDAEYGTGSGHALLEVISR